MQKSEHDHATRNAHTLQFGTRNYSLLRSGRYYYYGDDDDDEEEEKKEKNGKAETGAGNKNGEKKEE